VRDKTGSHTAGAGDSFMFPPGEAHQIINHASEDLVYYVIADNPIGECCYYPDSRKWLVTGIGERTTLKHETAEYFDGEE
jgi:uncharacterized cupin superfamily protein